MIVQGANDPSVKQEATKKIVQAMKKNGVKYQYLLFKDEGHSIIKESNRLKMYTAIEKFLNEHIKNCT